MGLLVLLILLAILVGVIVLQIFLSTRENKGLGLILPAVTFAFSILLLLGITPFTYSGSDVNGFMVVIGFMLPMNISTIVLLVIYAICRLAKGSKKNENSNNTVSNQIDKMNIQDLG